MYWRFPMRSLNFEPIFLNIWFTNLCVKCIKREKKAIRDKSSTLSCRQRNKHYRVTRIDFLPKGLLVFTILNRIWKWCGCRTPTLTAQVKKIVNGKLNQWFNCKSIHFWFIDKYLSLKKYTRTERRGVFTSEIFSNTNI